MFDKISSSLEVQNANYGSSLCFCFPGLLSLVEDFSSLFQGFGDFYFCDLEKLDCPIDIQRPFDFFVRCFWDTYKALSDEEKKKPLVLYGYSLGGRLALHVASFLRVQGIPFRLVLESAHPGLLDEKEKKQRLQDDIHLARYLETTKDWAGFIRYWFEKDIYGDFAAKSDFSEQVLKKCRYISVQRVQRCLFLFGLGHQQSFWSLLEEIAASTFYVSGLRDKKYTDLGKKLSQQGIKHLTFEKSGHNVHLEISDYRLSSLLF